ncbi:MAG TPA: UDP-2,3-diacylglucosamine diphosphatase [Rhizomicrobium sp.]
MIASLLTALPGATRKMPAKTKTPTLALNRIRRYRTIFISDTHLGTRGCKAERLADFLAHNDCQTLYLIGDIVDGWALKRNWYWPEAHNRVIAEILRKVESGTRVVYVPGNHDEALRDYTGLSLAGVELLPEAVHKTADGKQLLIIHGDQFDGIIAYAKWLAYLGDRAYELAIALNTVLNVVRRRMGMRYWSLSAYLKLKVKNAASFIGNFEKALVREAKSRGFDGVVCGHIHHAEVKDMAGILYCNDGDWVESCTALTEDAIGRLRIVTWADPVELLAAPAFITRPLVPEAA